MMQTGTPTQHASAAAAEAKRTRPPCPGKDSDYIANQETVQVSVWRGFGRASEELRREYVFLTYFSSTEECERRAAGRARRPRLYR